MGELAGTLNNPIDNNISLYHCISGRKNCFVWIKGDFKIDEVTGQELLDRNIFLVNVDNKGCGKYGIKRGDE